MFYKHQTEAMNIYNFNVKCQNDNSNKIILSTKIY